MSARTWVYTFNNYTYCDAVAKIDSRIRYEIRGLEIAPTTDTPHIQGYIEFNCVMRYAAVKKLYPNAYCELRRGTRDQARDYCRKGGIFIELGDWESGGQGRRTDLCKVRQAALDDGMRAVSSLYGLQSIRTAEIFLTYNETPRDWRTEVHWIWGPTGAGKSRIARDITEGSDIYTKSDGTKWWPGYDGHDTVIIDDFRDSWWSLTETLSLLDRYEKRVEFKGGYRQFKPKTIIITSCMKPENCYIGTGECNKQLLRRLSSVTELCN